MNPRRLLAGPVAVMLLASGASAIELNSSEALKYYGQGTQDFRVSPTGNALIDDGTLNITNNGEAVANFSGTGINLYKPLSVRSSGPLSVANGIELTGTSSNTIESLSTFYLSTSSGSASDIVLDPTGQVGVDSNLETTGDISVGGNQLNLENGDIENAGDIQTGSVSDSDGDNEIDFNSNRLTGLKDPNNEQDAATQSYVNSNDDTIQDNQGLEEVLSLDNKVGGENINFNETSNIQASGTNAITLDNNQNIGIPNGNVDIGSPSSTGASLDIDSSAKISGNNPVLRIDDIANGDAPQLQFQQDGTTEFRQEYDAANDEMRFMDDVDNNDILRLNRNSNVEIPNGNLKIGNNNVDNIASIDGNGDAIQTKDNLDLSGNSVNSADDIETNDILDDDDDTLRVQDNLQVEGKALINSESTVSSSSGSLYTGYNLDFPDDPYGGGGDTAFLTYRQDGSGENTELRLGITNDNQDNLVLEQGGATAVNIRGSQTVDIESGALELSNNAVNNVASIDGGGDAIQVKDRVQLNNNRLKTNTNGNYIEGNTASFSKLESGSGGEIDVQSDIDFNSVNMTNIQFEDAGDLNSDGDITNGNVENAELDNSKVTVAGNTVSLGSSTAVSINDLSDVSSTSETAGQTLLYDANNNQYTNARITAGQGLGRTTSNGGLTVSLNPGNGIETNSDNTRVNPEQIAGDGLKETSATSLDVEPANFAGSFLSDDGSDDLQVDTGTFISGDGNGNIDVDISDGLQDDESGNIEVNWNDADDLDNQGKISDFSEATDLDSDGDISDGSVQDKELDLADGLTVAGGAAGDGTQSGLEVDGNGNLYFSGSLNFPGDTNIISAQELNGSFLPSQDAQFNIGNASKQWKNGYFSGTVTAANFEDSGGTNLDDKYVNEGGDTMTGDLDMDGSRISNIGKVGGPKFESGGDLWMGDQKVYGGASGTGRNNVEFDGSELQLQGQNRLSIGTYNGGYDEHISMSSGGGQDVKIPNGNLDVSGGNINSANIVNTDFVQKAGGNADIEFAGSGRIDIRNSNNNDIIRARNSGEIEIPRGNLDVSNNNIEGVNNIYGDSSNNDVVFKDRPRSDDGLYIDSGKAFFDDPIRADQIRPRDDGTDTIVLDNNNNVNIPNGDLGVEGNQVYFGTANNGYAIQADALDNPDLKFVDRGAGDSPALTLKDGGNVRAEQNLEVEGKITEIGGKGSNEIKDDGDLVVDSDDKIEFAENGNTYMEVGSGASEGATQIDKDGDVTTSGRLDADTEGGEISDDSGSSVDVQTDGDVVVTLG